jgi:lysophospholipase L1-like esterase
MTHAVHLALGPLILAQALVVRRRIPKLPEASGPREGTAGQGPELRLLIAGDSAAAGVGASTQDEALAGRVVERLATEFRVAWRIEAATGATTRDTLARLAALDGVTFDVLVTSLGVNDLTKGMRTAAWLRAQRELRALARERLGVSLQVIAGLPPLDGFPSLPEPLRGFIGSRATSWSAALRQELSVEPDARYLDLTSMLDVGLMATDGFHPGPGIYADWGARAAGMIGVERAVGS